MHGRYLEVWERLPGSTGPYAAQAERDAQGQPTGAMRFVAGCYTLSVRPRTAAWPADLRPDETLAQVVQRHPAQAAALLDFDLVFSEAPA